MLLSFYSLLAVMVLSSAAGLRVALIGGSTRTTGPPTVLGPRVNAFIVDHLKQRGYEVTFYDPKTVALPLLERPIFSYASKDVPPILQEMQAALKAADAYVLITPEYNHAPSPGLINLLNHFGSSTFSFKPSAIVSYSAGQWGGTRAALGLRPILSELGCLPVSAMIHLPKVQEILKEDGSLIQEDTQARWGSHLDRCFSQLDWWGEASKMQRQKVDPFQKSPAFTRSPSQRNAP
jgi:chromate reductase, NAD(P)H dehydrogenase (quinone)